MILCALDSVRRLPDETIISIFGSNMTILHCTVSRVQKFNNTRARPCRMNIIQSDSKITSKDLTLWICFPSQIQIYSISDDIIKQKSKYLMEDMNIF